MTMMMRATRTAAAAVAAVCVLLAVMLVAVVSAGVDPCAGYELCAHGACEAVDDMPACTCTDDWSGDMCDTYVGEDMPEGCDVWFDSCNTCVRSDGVLTDDFAGDGPLLDYVTNNAASLPDVARIGGRYHANLTDNTDDITLHYNDDQGRLDARVVSFPFTVIARNIGIGTLHDSQTAPSAAGSPYLFAGVQVHVMDLDDRTSSHVVVGHRGPTAFTVEGKNTNDGSSSVNDDGANIVPDGRADIRIVGNADRTLTVSWQTPNLDGVGADSWNLYRGDGVLPGAAPTYGDTVYVGLITYAFGYTGVPFVGTCDGVEGGSNNATVACTEMDCASNTEPAYCVSPVDFNVPYDCPAGLLDEAGEACERLLNACGDYCVCGDTLPTSSSDELCVDSGCYLYGGECAEDSGSGSGSGGEDSVSSDGAAVALVRAGPYGAVFNSLLLGAIVMLTLML